jgi:hypothetical protein
MAQSRVPQVRSVPGGGAGAGGRDLAAAGDGQCGAAGEFVTRLYGAAGVVCAVGVACGVPGRRAA